MSFFLVSAESVRADCASGITVLVCVETDDFGWEITDAESVLFSGIASRQIYSSLSRETGAPVFPIIWTPPYQVPSISKVSPIYYNMFMVNIPYSQ